MSISSLFRPFKISRGKLVAGTAVVALAAAATTGMRQKHLIPSVTAAENSWNQALLALMPTAIAPYQLPIWLRNGHVETIYAAKFRKNPRLLYDREIVHMPDGGCVCLDTEVLPAEKVKVD